MSTTCSEQCLAHVSAMQPSGIIICNDARPYFWLGGTTHLKKDEVIKRWGKLRDPPVWPCDG